MGPSDDPLGLALEAARQLHPEPRRTALAVERALRRAHAAPPPTLPWWRLAAAVGAVGVTALAMFVAVPSRPLPAPVAPAVSRVASPEPLPPPSSDVVTALSPLVEAVPGDASWVREAGADDETRVRVRRGVMVFHLKHGAAPHHLRVIAGPLEVEAVGTVFSVGFDGERPQVRVFDGRVVASAGSVTRTIDAGERWSPGQAVTREDIDEHVLGRFGLPPRRVPRLITPAASVTAAPAWPAVWREARLARSRGDRTATLAALDRLVRSGDAVWAPIALVERARVHLANGSNDAARSDLEAFLARYPGHELVPEALGLAEPLLKR